MIVGTTSENIMAKMMPGTIRQMSPITIKIPVTIPAPSNEGSRLTVKPRVSRRSTLRLSRMPEATLTAMPPTTASTIHLTRTDKNSVASKTPNKERKYDKMTSGEAVGSGRSGAGNIQLTTSPKVPVRKPATRNGTKNNKKLEK